MKFLDDEKISAANFLQSTTPLTSKLVTQKKNFQFIASSPLKLFDLNDLEILNTIGTGTFGRVKLARYPPANKFFALKIMKKKEILRLNQVEHVFSERAILTALAHPFIVRLYSTFQNSENLYMLLEYIQGGELFSVLRRAKRFDDLTAKFYASELVLAIEYMHSLNVVYRDLKPENLLIDTHGHLKIADFGFAKALNDGKTWTLCGTPEYLAPEIIKNEGHGFAVDWWALGVLIYEMLVGSPPFYDNSSYKIYEKILSGNIIFPSCLSPFAKDIIQKLLIQDPTLRLGNLNEGVNDIKKHSWFAGIVWNDVYHKRNSPPFIPKFYHSGDTSNFDVYSEEETEVLLCTKVKPSKNDTNSMCVFDGY